MRCGKTKTCYLPFRYQYELQSVEHHSQANHTRSCENGNLTEILSISGPFELEAVNLIKPLTVKLRACGHNFWLKEKDEDSCTLCPEKVRQQGGCPPGKDTVFLPGRNMVSNRSRTRKAHEAHLVTQATLVPGGQRYYVNPIDGALQFSIPHSSIDPTGAISNLVALQNGTFAIFPGVKGWLACPQHSKNGTGEGIIQWRIHAQLPHLVDVKDCSPVNLVTVPWKPKEGSNSTFAAWEYI